MWLTLSAYIMAFCVAGRFYYTTNYQCYIWYLSSFLVFFLSLSMVLYLVQQQEKVNFTHKHILDAVLFPSFMENAYYI